MARIEFRQVEKIFPGGTVALSNLDLQVADGELLVCVGPSGCGKSTVLRLLAGLETPTSGSLWIGDQRVDELSPQARNVAMVFQDYALYPHMSVRGNLEFPLKMRRLARAEIDRRVAWAAEVLAMDGWLDRLPRQLSGGQRQRVAMGRALVREPAVFLLDEPLSNLDARTRVRVRDEIAELQRRTGTTMIYVTHDQTEAMTLGQRVAVLNAGRLQQVGSAREIYDRPANAFVAGFIGSPPMNLFPTRLSREGDVGLRMAVGGQELVLDAPPWSRAECERRLGEPLTGGVRPECLRPALASEAGHSLAATVEQLEQLGHETLVHVEVDGPAADASSGEETVRLIVRLPGMHGLHKGDGLRLVAEPGGIHLFDAAGVALRADSLEPRESER